VVTTSLREKLIKISHHRYATFQRSEAVALRHMFVKSCR
jgi:hypothetical protein